MQSIQKCGLEDCKVAKDIDIALLRSCNEECADFAGTVLFAREIFSHRAGRNGAGDS